MPSAVFALPPCITSIISNLYECRGSLRDREGNWYQGDMRNGKFHGLGMIQYTNGEKFEGEFKDNMFLKGSFYHLNGATYDGEWINNTFNGQGVYRYPNGIIAVGEWKDGQPNGRQIHYDKNKCVLRSGIFTNGVFSFYEEVDVQKFDRITFSAQGSCVVR